MYKNGLHFPIFYFFLNDDVIINDLNDIILRKNNFIVDTEDNTFNAIIEFINQSKGYEIFPFILNNFDGEKIVKTDVGRTVRFYVAKSHKRLIKLFDKGTSSQIVKGYNIEIINKLPEHFPINIDYSY